MYHIRKDGTYGECGADVRKCPLGGEHFKTIEEAEASVKPVSETHTSKPFKVDTGKIDWATAGRFKKAATVTIRRAKEDGEKLVTKLSNGQVETVNTLKKHDVIVKNPSGEEYAMAPQKFFTRYGKNKDGTYSSKVEVEAVENHTGKSVVIDAPWGEKQYGDKNCMFVKNGESIYIVGRKEFEETYVETEASIKKRARLNVKPDYSKEEFDLIKKVGSTKLDKPVLIENSRFTSTVSALNNSSYLGAHLSGESLDEINSHLLSIVGKDKFEKLVASKNKRDGNSDYHLTVISPPELSKLNGLNVSTVEDLNKEVNISVKGIGRVVDEDSNKEAWFTVCSSDEVEALREKHNLGNRDLHITLGFINGDIHNLPKDETSLIVTFNT